MASTEEDMIRSGQEKSLRGGKSEEPTSPPLGGWWLMVQCWKILIWGIKHPIRIGVIIMIGYFLSINTPSKKPFPQNSHPEAGKIFRY
jgi:hypothetical protein